MTKDNILSVKDVISDYSPGGVARGVASRLRQRRLELNLSQEALSARSGVSLGTLKRFERSARISFNSLILLAISLQATGGFKALFSEQHYSSFDEAVGLKKSKSRKRGRINV